MEPNFHLQPGEAAADSPLWTLAKRASAEKVGKLPSKNGEAGMEENEVQYSTPYMCTYGTYGVQTCIRLPDKGPSKWSVP